MNLSNTPCFLIGNGPSLENEWREEINEYFTIGVNRAFLKTEPSILFWQDVSINADFKNREIINNLKSIKISNEKCAVYTKIDIIVDVAPSQFKLCDNPYIYYGGTSTGVNGFCMAQILGFSPIILLGMDAKYDGDKTNFYGINKFHTQGIINKGRVLENFQVAMQFLKDIENKIPNKIISCSDNNYFKKSNIDDVLKNISTKKTPLNVLKNNVLSEFARLKPPNMR